MIKELITWSEKRFADLPWREERTLYSTLVSEVMLQQTTVGTVLNHYDRFLKEYPTLKKLAQASEEQLLISWKGLGYYRRAKNLLKAAKEIQTVYNGKIPLDKEKLLSINGIGPYTANALLSIGANKEALALDANLERVLARFYKIDEEKGPKLNKALYQMFDEGKIVPNIKKLGPRALNEALMDLGRSICKARSAACEECPLAKKCQSYQHNCVEKYPVLKVEKRKQGPLELHLLRVIVTDSKDQVLVYKKEKDKWLSGQFEVPTFILYSEDPKLKQYPTYEGLKDDWEELPTFKTGITKYKIKNTVWRLSSADFKKEFKKISKQKSYKFLKIDKKTNLSTSTFKALGHVI